MPLSQLDPYWQTRDEAMVRLYHGDALEVLERLPSQSVHCAVTSPPYWGLRKYLTDDNRELGLESHPDLYVSRLVEVFRELRRVLRDDGTFWLNLGSSSASGIIESEDYVIREDLTDEEYNYASVAIAKALSSVWGAHESAEHSLPTVLVQSMGEAGELSDEGVSEMQEGVSDTQVPNRDRAGKVLLSKMCSSRLSGSQEEVSNGGLSDMRDAVQQVYKQPQKESRKTELLQQGLLVCVQPEGQSLPLDRGSKRQDEPGGAEVAKGSPQKGQTPLPSMSLSQQTGSTSHNAVRNASRGSLGADKRDYLVPLLPRKVPRTGDEGSRDVQTNCNHKSRIVITLRKQDIPPGILRFFRPVYRLLPGNDIGIPWRVAFALQADGWILRQEIIWEKPSPMPESVTNRCTKSHEYVFMFVKKAGYFFDQFAIKEKAVSTNERRPSAKEKISDEKACLSNARYTSSRPLPVTDRNKRSVWTVSNSGYKGAHFATFSGSLILPCIKAGTSEKGCCTECGAPWKRVVERTRTPTRPGENSKVYNGRSSGETGGLYSPPGQPPHSNARLAGEVTGNRDPERHVTSLRHLGWYPSCKCYGLPPMPPAPPYGKDWNGVRSGDGVSDEAAGQGGARGKDRARGVSVQPDGPDDPVRESIYAEWVKQARELCRQAEEEHGDSVDPCVVLDPFVGSGTTAVVCLGLGRYSIGIDLSEDYLRNNAIPRIEGELLGRPVLASLVPR
jgi:DNA modification methylase